MTFFFKRDSFGETQNVIYEEEKFNGMEFDWEGAFGSLTNERLEQLQRYATNQDYVSKFSEENLPHEKEEKEGIRNTNMKNKMVTSEKSSKSFIPIFQLWSKVNSLSVQELRLKGSIIGGRRMRNLLNAISVNISK